MHLYLIRHAESIANAFGVVQGHGDYPLTELGKQQAQLLGEWMKNIPLQAIYSSDLSRAYETATAISKHHHIQVKKWPLIREIYLGSFEGMTKEEIISKFPQLINESILTSEMGGAESILSITSRCKKTVQFLMENHIDDHVALVSHGGFISILLTYFMLSQSWESIQRPFIIHNTGVSKVHINKKGMIKFHYINQTAHLQH